MNKSDLFPLSTVYGSNWNGYWIDTDYNVYSTKQKDTPYKLARTGSGSCTGKYYSLSTGRFTGSTAYKVEDIKREVNLHAGFIAYKGTRTVAKSTMAPIAMTGYIVGSIRKDGSFSFAMQPKVHYTECSAKSETERLAKATPGTTYVYLEVKGRCKAGGVTWN